MNRSQNVWLAEYQSLDKFFQLLGAPLLAIPDLSAAWLLVRAAIPLILIQATYQARTGTAARAARRALKLEAATRGEALRAALLAYVRNPLHPDTALADAFRTSLARKVSTAPDADFLLYLTALLKAAHALAIPLALAGVEEADLDTLDALLQALNATLGDAPNTDAVAETATTELEKLFRQTNQQLSSQLDLLVRAQSLKQPLLAQEYLTLRHPAQPARRKRATVLKGELHPGQPVFLFDRTTADAPIPIFGNDSGRRRILRYFSAPTPDPTTAPAHAGLLAKNRRRRPLDDYAHLGDPTNPYVFVVLLGTDGPGYYYVRLQ